jgi:hypothetical protein
VPIGTDSSFHIDAPPLVRDRRRRPRFIRPCQPVVSQFELTLRDVASEAAEASFAVGARKTLSAGSWRCSIS